MSDDRDVQGCARWRTVLPEVQVGLDFDVAILDHIFWIVRDIFEAVVVAVDGVALLQHTARSVWREVDLWIVAALVRDDVHSVADVGDVGGLARLSGGGEADLQLALSGRRELRDGDLAVVARSRDLGLRAHEQLVLHYAAVLGKVFLLVVVQSLVEDGEEHVQVLARVVDEPLGDRLSPN